MGEQCIDGFASAQRSAAPLLDSRIGLALGSGGARGWSHIGALKALQERGLRPGIVAGSSMGALVGAAYAVGRLDDLEEWALRLSPRRMLGLLDPNLRRGGLMEGARIVRFLREILPDIAIEDMPCPYLAVATDLESGQEIWLKEGSLIEAVRASIALPGLFSPAPHGDSWLVDGGLCNPVPVSAARALGAEIVVAVNPNSKLRRRSTSGNPTSPDGGALAVTAAIEAAALAEAAAPEPVAPKGRGFARLTAPRLRAGLSRAAGALVRPRRAAPRYLDVISNSMEIMTDRIRSSRLAGDPPHVLLQPQLSHRSVLEFYRAAEAIEEGRASVAREQATLEVYCGCEAA